MSARGEKFLGGGRLYNTYCESGDFSIKGYRERAGIGDDESVALLENSRAEKFFKFHLANEAEDRARLSACVLDPERVIIVEDCETFAIDGSCFGRGLYLIWTGSIGGGEAQALMLIVAMVLRKARVDDHVMII